MDKEYVLAVEDHIDNVSQFSTYELAEIEALLHPTASREKSKVVLRKVKEALQELEELLNGAY